jgi:N-acylneuraminate cytidylyltransferase
MMSLSDRPIAFIPARGGSRRLPGKNVKLLCGKPLIWYTIHAALQSGEFGRVIVSTDDAEISAISRACGAEVLRRPEVLASDTATTAEAAQHCAAALDTAGEAAPLVTLQPTQPFRPASLFREALAAFAAASADSLICVSENPLKLGRIENDRFVPSTYTAGQRSQDLDPLYFENGLIYISRLEMVRKGDLFGEHRQPLVVDTPHARVDIDDAVDFALAECYLRTYPDIYPFT